MVWTITNNNFSTLCYIKRVILKKSTCPPFKEKHSSLAIHIQLAESVVSENFHYFRRAKIEFRVCEGNVNTQEIQKYWNTKEEIQTYRGPSQFQESKNWISGLWGKCQYMAAGKWKAGLVKEVSYIWIYVHPYNIFGYMSMHII